MKTVLLRCKDKICFAPNPDCYLSNCRLTLLHWRHIMQPSQSHHEPTSPGCYNRCHRAQHRLMFSCKWHIEMQHHSLSLHWYAWHIVVQTDMYLCIHINYTCYPRIALARTSENLNAWSTSSVPVNVRHSGASAWLQSSQGITTKHKETVSLAWRLCRSFILWNTNDVQQGMLNSFWHKTLKTIKITYCQCL